MRGTIFLIFAIICLMIHSGDAGFQSGSRSFYGKNSSSKLPRSSLNLKQNDDAINNDKASQLKQTKRVGGRSNNLSAWGIIGIVLAAILFITSGYYAFVFYPFLCKKERNYDMIELTNVV
ncbi:hypothetical protein PV327_006364 [Microctonus hyperodae]|uniref:Transmembrane protein n=1 Tax=Microctonus hyperodae TaxID=165561 RepID=A0AA39F474_MICHY|nr:hypothetical protein PV327_006364 [Microctonus hyperodae]